MDARPVIRLLNTLRVLWKHITLAAFIVLVALVVLPRANAMGTQADIRKAVAGALFAALSVCCTTTYSFVESSEGILNWFRPQQASNWRGYS